MAKSTVFVSHAHVDNEICDRYVFAVRARGFDIWYDRTNLQTGNNLSDVIQREIQGRSAFIVMLTPASVNSYWVKLETGAFRDLAAHESSRIMLPVRIKSVEVPLLFRGIKWIDAVNLPLEKAINEIVRGLEGQEFVQAPSMPPLKVSSITALRPYEEVKATFSVLTEHIFMCKPFLNWGNILKPHVILYLDGEMIHRIDRSLLMIRTIEYKFMVDGVKGTFSYIVELPGERFKLEVMGETVFDVRLI